ncbi:MAG TPA: PLD nuclease N-terminal domain-containing protein [Candidatus Limnocylindria bacterium]
MTLEEALPLLIPLAILQIVLVIAALYDLSRPERRVKGDNKLVWVVVIVLFQMLGPLAYFLLGREED